MCNLYSNITTQAEMRRVFEVEVGQDHLGNAPAQAAIFPRHDAPVVRLDAGGKRELRMMHWGFPLPQVSKKTGKPILPKPVNNARDDKLQTSRFWAASFRERRCLVPASSFCEAQGRNPAIWHWFGLRGDEARPPFAFAGLWRGYKGRYKDEEVDILAHTVVTTTPNALVKPVHPDRMAVILDPQDYATWLHGSEAEAMALCRPYPAERMCLFRAGPDQKSDPGQAATG